MISICWTDCVYTVLVTDLGSVSGGELGVGGRGGEWVRLNKLYYTITRNL